VNKDKLERFTRYFRCKDDSALIHPTLVCDGNGNCDDNSDENECATCPRANNMVVNGQMIQLNSEEIRELDHLRNTAIMQDALRQ
jgi:hypothetical protein